MEPHRAERVTEAIREELSEIIGYEMSDPRIGEVYVTEVHVAPDLRKAIVRIGGLPLEPKEIAAALEALEGARSFLRKQLAHRLQLYRVPELHFEADAAVRTVRIDHLLKRIRKGRPRGEAPAANPDEKKAVE